MMDIQISKFYPGTIEEVSRSIGDLFSGRQITSILIESELVRHDPGEGTTKWRRIETSISRQQSLQGDGRPLVSFVSAAMRPDRLISAKGDLNECKTRLNLALSFAGYSVRDDGKVGKVPATKTLGEALKRSQRLRQMLEMRGAHLEVLRHCRPELLKKDYYEAVFESIKGLGERLRTLGNIDDDGRSLVQYVLGGRNPLVPINDLSTSTKRNEQIGTELIAEGLYAAFRNPQSHETRLTWNLSEHDALDVLGALSLVHRRLDQAEKLQSSRSLK
jgi:TIGR02391 family protein